MASINNILLTAENPPSHKYAKTIKSKLSGPRLDPISGKEIPFILESNRDGFSYDNDVIELYSDKEHRFFLQANKKFLVAGYLKQYSGEAEEVSLDNVLSDEDVELIATIRTIPALTKRLSSITSPVTLLRIRDMVVQIGRPQSVISCINSRIEELS